ncbi:ABC transporter ATP-binding protein [Brucella anthropi]|uniref:ABC transporter ATP-binding protein n=1 Tax=Brucella anthropi TaxID=529 RepID=UPI001CFEA3B2|nr:sn-glycerol-3-phosphate ABC transporter ATP-binding protein UgpC [Brucella anthropi]
MASVSLQNVRKQYGALTVVHGVNLSLEDGEFVAFLGPSGCGKSTTLRMIAGLESVTSGSIFIGDREVTRMQPADRNIGMVFQNYALYPHKTVRENLGFSLKINGFPKDEIARRIERVTAMMNLGPLLDRKPKQLSGGQMQRVALGRTLARDANVFLLDEPLSNLDAKLRAHMRIELSQLHRKVGKTMIYVTHDQVEAMTMADKIVVMHDGRVEQVGTPLEIFDRPATRFVAGFVGSPEMNFLEGKIAETGIAIDGAILAAPIALPKGTPLIVGIRPEHIELASGAPQEFVVDVSEQLGTTTLLVGTLFGQRVQISAPRTTVQTGDVLRVNVSPSALHFFDPQTGARIER